MKGQQQRHIIFCVCVLRVGYNNAYETNKLYISKYFTKIIKMGLRGYSHTNISQGQYLAALSDKCYEHADPCTMVKLTCCFLADLIPYEK